MYLLPPPTPVKGDTEGRSMHGVALSYHPSCRAQAIKTAAERDNLSRPLCVRCLIAVVGLPHSAGAYGWVSRTCLRGGAVFRPASPSSSVFLCNFGRDLSFPSGGGGGDSAALWDGLFFYFGEGLLLGRSRKRPCLKARLLTGTKGPGGYPLGLPSERGMHWLAVVLF